MNGFPERWIIILPRCLPVEQFPTFASGRQGRGATTLSDFRCQFHLTMPRDVAEEATEETGVSRRLLENAKIVPLGHRSYNRPFDIRVAWADMLC
jgi:hypothetical protein